MRHGGTDLLQEDEIPSHDVVHCPRGLLLSALFIFTSNFFKFCNGFGEGAVAVSGKSNYFIVSFIFNCNVSGV